MITLDTRLLKQWIVSLVAILLSSVEATVTTSCDISSVDEGQQPKLTCMFSEDISRTQVDFKVELYRLDREPLSVPILDCIWFNGKLDCRVHSCCSFDRKVTDNATLVILNATQDLVGKYMCHVVPSSPGSSHFCNFTVNKIVSTDRPIATATEGEESNSSPGVPVIVGVVVSVVVVAVIAIIVIVYMCRKRRYRNVLSDNIPKEDNSSENEDPQSKPLTTEKPALERVRKPEVDPLLKKYDTTDSNTALDIINEKYPKSTNNQGRPNKFEDGQQSEKMTEAKHSDTTISELEVKHYDTTNAETEAKHYDTTNAETEAKHYDITNSETEAKHYDTTNSETEAKHYDITNSETEAKHSDTTNAETEAKHYVTTNSETKEINFASDTKWSPKKEERYNFLQEITNSHGDLNDASSASMKPYSENCTPRLPNLNEGARAVPDKAGMDSYNIPLHNLQFGDANPPFKEEFTVNDKESQPCSLAALDPFGNATNGNETVEPKSREHFLKIVDAKFDVLRDFTDLTSENKNEDEDFILE